MSGLTDAGLQIEVFADIRDGINTDAKNEVSPTIDVSDGSIEGRFIGIFSLAIANCWELLEVIYNAFNPDTATGASQDNICAITGTQRVGESPSTDTITLVGDADTLVPSGSIASVTGTDEQFITSADATLVLLASWANTHAYVIGDRVTNGGNAYQCIDPGTSAGSGGPVSTDPTDVTPGETDGSVAWRFLGVGTAAVDITSSSSDLGPIVADAGTLTRIVTPVGGWSAVVNILDAVLGTNIEDSEHLRVRRDDELATPGTSPVDAIRDDLLNVSGVTAVGVFQNTSDVTNLDGLPPHSVQALVQCPDNSDMNQLIWNQLLASVGGGIVTYGDVIGTATDAGGNVWTMAFSRPEEFDIYVTAHLIIDPNTFPSDGVTQVKDAITKFGNAGKAGKDVVASSCGAQAFKLGESILDVPSSGLFIGTSPSPGSSTTIAISLRQIAKFDSSRIVITTENGVP